MRLIPLPLIAVCVLAGEAPPPASGSIAPVAASASGSQASNPGMVIDGSGLREDPAHPGVFTHLANRWSDGGCMWTNNAKPLSG